MAKEEGHLRNERALREGLKELAAREFWTIRQMASHVPPDVYEQILMDRKVNPLLPGFTWQKAVEAT